jgi:cobalt/nickel transport system permease protein
VLPFLQNVIREGGEKEMHIPDGLLNPVNPATHALNIADVTVLLATWAITLPCIVFAWRKTRQAYPASFTATLAIMSALVFVVQMLTFPVAGGTSVHILGGTLLAVVLGPYAGMLSMTMVLGMQAVFFGDGGLMVFGANALNMAVIGSLSFFLVKVLMGKSGGTRRFAQSLFAATFVSAVLTALLTGVEIGVSSAFVGAGGIAVTVPAMLSVYTVEGLVEAALTGLVGTALMASLSHTRNLSMNGLGGFGFPRVMQSRGLTKSATKPRATLKNMVLLLGVIMVVFAVFLPFISTTPDGLEATVANSADAAQQQKPLWNGLIADYSVALADPYISTLVAGLFGVGLVLAVSVALSTSIKRKGQTEALEQVSC